MLKELDSSKLMEVNGGHSSIATDLGYLFGRYVKSVRSPQGQAWAREMNREHYGY